MDQYAQWTKGEYIANEFKSKIKTWKPENCPCKPLNLPSENGLPSRYWLAYVHRCYYLCFFILFHFIFWYIYFYYFIHMHFMLWSETYARKDCDPSAWCKCRNCSTIKTEKEYLYCQKWRLFAILILRVYLSWVKQ